MSTPSVDPTAAIHPSVHLGPGCRVGAGASLASGVFLQAAVELGARVKVGPNAVLIQRDFAEDGTAGVAPILVGDHVSIGANATVLGGVVIGEHAVVGAGAVVTRAVPAHAVVAGNPARIVGYASSPTATASKQVVASALADEAFPLRVGRVELRRLPTIVDLRGALSHGEFPGELPFVPRRCFLVYGVPSPEVRGEHAHRALEELLLCVSGEVAVAVDDGVTRGEIVLDRPDVALHLPPMVWSRQYRYSPEAVLVALASAPYDAKDYVRVYEEFRDLVQECDPARG